MGMLHFLGFISAISEKQKQFFIHGLFILFAIDQSAPLLIYLGLDMFAYVKVTAFITFEGFLAWVLICIFRDSLRDFS
jgi:hypothetical protein